MCDVPACSYALADGITCTNNRWSSRSVEWRQLWRFLLGNERWYLWSVFIFLFADWPCTFPADRQRRGVLAHIRGCSEQPAQPAAPALHWPGWVLPSFALCSCISVIICHLLKPIPQCGTCNSLSAIFGTASWSAGGFMSTHKASLGHTWDLLGWRALLNTSSEHWWPKSCELNAYIYSFLLYLIH